MARSRLLQSFEIEDPLELQSEGAIEVTVTLVTGEKRWCCFMTPKALTNCGDWIDGTTIRFHQGCPHLIVVAAQLDRDIIEGALRTIDRMGALKESTSAVQ